MRVLHLAKFYPPYAGGMEIFLRDLAVATHAAGVENYIFSHAFGDRRNVLYEDIVENIPVLRVPTPLQLLYAPISPSYFFHLKSTLHTFTPDCIHAHFPNLSAFWALALPQNIPLVVHWHADVIFPPEKWLHRLAYVGYRQLEKRLLARADCIITTSPQYQRHSRVLQPVADKCVCIPLGIDEERLQLSSPESCEAVRRKYGIAQGETLFLSVGRFSHYKGFHVLVDAVSRISKTLPAKFVIVGDGEEFSTVQQQIMKKGVCDKITLTGKLPDDELAALFQAADAYCLPSIERTEAFGVVLLEAMAAAKPVISSAITGSGVCHVVENGHTGMQVRPGCHTSLAEALGIMANNPALRCAMGGAARKRFDSMFTIEKVATQITDVYAAVTGK